MSFRRDNGRDSVRHRGNIDDLLTLSLAPKQRHGTSRYSFRRYFQDVCNFKTAVFSGQAGQFFLKLPLKHRFEVALWPRAGVVILSKTGANFV